MHACRSTLEDPTALSWLAGAPLVAGLGTLTALAFAVARLLRASRSSTGHGVVRARVARTVLALTLGLAGATIEWWPAIEARAESLAALPDPTRLDRERAPIATLATGLVPDLFGSARDAHATNHDPIPWLATGPNDVASVREAEPAAWCLYAGLAVAILSLVALVSRPRAAAGSGVLLLLGVGFAQAWPGSRALLDTGLFAWGPLEHARVLTWFAWPWLAATGLEALLESAPRARLTAIAAAAVLFVAGAFAALTFQPAARAAATSADLARRHGVSLEVASSVVPPEAARAGFERVQAGLGRLALLAGGLLVAAGLALRARPGSSARVVLPWCALVAIDGALTAHAFVRVSTRGDRDLFPASETMEAIAATAGDGRVLRFDRSGLGDAIVSPSLLRAYGISDLSSDGPYPDADLAQFVAGVDPRSLRSGGVGAFADERALASRVLDGLRVTCVLSREPLRVNGLRLAYQRGSVYVHARAGAVGLARVAPAAPIVAASAAAARELVADPDRDPRAEVVLVAGSPSREDALRGLGTTTARGGPAGAGGAAEADSSPELEVTRPSPARLDAHVIGEGGWLVFHERYVPGWRARVDGLEVPVLRADHHYRAVPIPAGDVRVETYFAPTSLLFGGWATLAAWIALAALAWTKRRAIDAPEALGVA